MLSGQSGVGVRGRGLQQDLPACLPASAQSKAQAQRASVVFVPESDIEMTTICTYYKHYLAWVENETFHPFRCGSML